MKNQTLTGLIIILIISTLMSACNVPSTSQRDGQASAGEPEGTISISGAFALYPMMTVWAEEYTKLHPAVYFDVQGGGAGKGMTDVIAGAVDIGMISRTIKDEEIAQGVFWVSVTKDAVFPIISAENPVAEQIMKMGIPRQIFNKVFITGEITTWGQVVGNPSITDEIHVFTRSDASGAAEQWSKYAGGTAQEDLLGIGINGEPFMVETIIKDPLGLGYGNLNSVFDLGSGNMVQGILVPPLDVNEDGKANQEEVFTTKEDAFNAVANSTYPSPPARFENLAILGKPTGITLAFIEWILTDGQQYLKSAGFVPLTPEQQADSLEKLK